MALVAEAKRQIVSPESDTQVRHRVAGSADRVVDGPYRSTDSAFQNSSKGSLFAPGPVEPRGEAPQAVDVPQNQQSGALQECSRKAFNPPLVYRGPYSKQWFLHSPSWSAASEERISKSRIARIRRLLSLPVNSPLVMYKTFGRFFGREGCPVDQRRKQRNELAFGRARSLLRSRLTVRH